MGEIWLNAYACIMHLLVKDLPRSTAPKSCGGISCDLRGSYKKLQVISFLDANVVCFLSSAMVFLHIENFTLPFFDLFLHIVQPS